MKQLAQLKRKVGKAIGIIFGAVIVLGVGILAFMFFFLMPVGFALETFDLAMMDSKTVGVVTNVETKTLRGKSSTQISYQFKTNGRTENSKRVFPGIFGNKGGFTRSSLLASQFPVGNPCDVYFDSSNPSRCALKYGWFCWSVGFSAAVWGMYLAWFFESRSSVLALLAKSFMFYGGGLLFVGPLSVDVSDLQWHLLAMACIMIAVVIYHRIGRKIRKKGDQQIAANPSDFPVSS